MLKRLAYAALMFAAFSTAPVLAQESPEKPGDVMKDPGEMKEPGEAKEEALPKRKKRGKKGKKGRGNMREMLKELGLTPEQRQQLGTAMRDMREKIQGLREGGGRPDRAAMQKIRKAFNEALMKVLTPEQKEKYKSLRSGMQRGARGRRGGMGQGAGQALDGAQLIETAKKIMVLGKTQQEPAVALMEKILQQRKELAQFRARERMALLAFLKEGALAEDVDAKVAAFRKQRDAKEAALKASQDQLAAMLDKEQKAKALALGFLR